MMNLGKLLLRYLDLNKPKPSLNVVLDNKCRSFSFTLGGKRLVTNAHKGFRPDPLTEACVDIYCHDEATGIEYKVLILGTHGGDHTKCAIYIGQDVCEKYEFTISEGAKLVGAMHTVIDTAYKKMNMRLDGLVGRVRPDTE